MGKLRGMTQTEAKWADRVQQWKASGRTLEEFSEGQPFKASTLRWWTTELRRRNERGGRDSTDGIRMARVVRRRARVATGPTTSRVVLEVSGVCIAVERGFDAELLSQVVQAIGGGR